MTEWAFILTPLLVLSIILLFRFVGCGIDATGKKEPAIVAQLEGPPKYKEFILGNSNNPGEVKNPVKADIRNVIAYWRLVDDPATSEAKEEKGFLTGDKSRFGEYRLNDAPDTAPDFDLGTALIDSEPTAVCRKFNGGYVRVPYSPGLYTEEFTIEAWIRQGTFSDSKEHTLFFAGGHYLAPFGLSGTKPEYHGFRIFAANNKWGVQVFVTPESNIISKPPIVPSGRSHLAVTWGNTSSGKKKFIIFVNGKKAAEEDKTLGSGFLPDGAPLLIGVGSAKSDPSDLSELKEPVRSEIQEVVLHNKALSEEEIQNHFCINFSKGGTMPC